MGGHVVLVGLLNYIVDLCLLLGANRLAGHPPEYKRAAAAAAVGGLYGGACMVPRLHFLGNGLWWLVSIALMGWIAYYTGAVLRRCVLFGLLSMALSGVVLGMGNGRVLALTAGAVILCLMCVIGFRGGVGRTFVPVILRHGGRKVALTALQDTGNTLRDPLTGQTVLVVGPKTAAALTGLTREQLKTPAQSLTALPGLRLLPFKTVATAGSLLLAMRLQEVTIGTWQGSCLVAFAPEGFESDEFQALTGGTV